MSILEQKYEKGRLVTRLCGLRVWRSATEPALSVQAQLLRRELLTAADVANMPPLQAGCAGAFRKSSRRAAGKWM